MGKRELVEKAEFEKAVKLDSKRPEKNSTMGHQAPGVAGH